MSKPTGKTCMWILMSHSSCNRVLLQVMRDQKPAQMRVGMPLRLKETSREPQASAESLWESRTPNTLNPLSFPIVPVENRMYIEARIAGSREVRPNIQ
jgi:hypothetical protein